MDDYANLTKCNVLHSFRLCSKESFFSRNYSFHATRDCTTTGIAFNISINILVAILTILGNLLVPAVLWRRRRTQWGPYAVCKLWLCACDIIICAVYLSTRVVMMLRVLYSTHRYERAFVVEVAKELARTYNREVSAPGVETVELHNYTYYLWPNDGGGPYNLQMLFKLYEMRNRNLVTAMSCFLGTYILVCTWILAVMSVDRYLAIVFPFKYQRWVSVARMKVALATSTVISVSVGTVWPITHLDLFFPSINNRFGFGAIFLLGRHRVDNSREILFFYASWLLPLLAVIIFNLLTAFYCLFLMPSATRCRGTCCYPACCADTKRRFSTASELSNLRYHPAALTGCCCGPLGRKPKVGPTPDVTGAVPGPSSAGESPAVPPLKRTSVDKRRADDTLEAFWTLALMTIVFLVIMGPSFVLTVFVPVPCEDATKWTWIYIGVQFLFMNQPSHHIVVYNFRSGVFRREAGAVLRSLAGKAKACCRG